MARMLLRLLIVVTVLISSLGSSASAICGANGQGMSQMCCCDIDPSTTACLTENSCCTFDANHQAVPQRPNFSAFSADIDIPSHVLLAVLGKAELKDITCCLEQPLRLASNKLYLKNRSLLI